MIVVQAGNRIDVAGREKPRFPAERIPAVARRLDQLLEVLEPSGVVTAIAAGADILIAEAAIRGGIPLHVVLPFTRDLFRVESVEDQGGRWADAYDAVIDHLLSAPGCTLRELQLDADDAGFRLGNDALIARAFELGGRRVLAVAVHPRAGPERPHERGGGPDQGPTSVVDDFVEKAEAAGLFVLELDPLQP